MKTPARFVIWGNTEKPAFWDVLPSLADWAADQGIGILLTTKILAEMDGKPDFPHEVLESADGFLLADFVLTLGGDGTFLSAAQAVRHRQIPILGIHLGELGFLAQVTVDDLFPRLNQVARGQYVVEQQLVLEGRVSDDTETTWIAVNDFVVSHARTHRMLSCRVYANQRLVGNYKADGMIVATPVGSTAYSLSAGGPIVEPGVESLVLTPICPHTLTSRPLVLPSRVEIAIDFPHDHRDPVDLSADGQTRREILPPQRLVISRAPFTIPFLTFEDKNYYQTLRRKMGWGRRGDREFAASRD
ncbi:MAG: NAD(+)/NADH kinase [Candidatus Neomarinimicrobiota bacterium]|nr:MAG: NAD(+)/NADH kinase [Candidatus Neomarinimicrobiota bacterium]